MSQHKINPMASRPTCGTCPHFVREKAGVGHCRFAPPMTFLQTMVNRLNPQQMQEILKSGFPPVTVDKWCGQHPDFMRWWSQHRDSFAADAELDAAEIQGAA